MNTLSIARSLAVVATRADIARAAQNLGGPAATASIYLLLQQRIKPPPAADAFNPTAQAAWELRAAGTYNECLARVVSQAVDVVTGTLRGPAGGATPEHFIAHHRAVLDAALPATALPGLSFRVSMLTHGVSDRVHAHRAAWSDDPVWPQEDRRVTLASGLAAVLAVRYLGEVVAFQGAPFAYLAGGAELLDRTAVVLRGAAAA